MAQRATSLGPKPSLVSFVVFFAFLSWFLIEKPVFSPQKGHFCCSLFCVSLCFFLAFLGPPHFSLSLSLSLSCSFLSSFLPFCFSFLYLVLVFLFVCFYISSCFLFLFFCLSSCFVLNHNLRFVLLCILFSRCCCFLPLSYFVIFWFLETYQKHLWKHGNSKNSKNEKRRKNGHFDKSS